MSVKPRDIMNDTVMMIVATIGMVLLFLYGYIDQWAGVAMVGVLGLYVLYQYKSASKNDEKEIVEEIENPEFASPKLAYIFLILGLLLIAGGAEFLVRGAQMSATILGVPEAVIALSLIALGTSLPELATCVAAALKKQTDLIVGNIIGSNVFNILMILGIAAAIKPIDVTTAGDQIVSLDMWITLAVTILFSIWLLVFKKIDRKMGIAFVTGYVVYILAIYAIYM